MSKRTASSEDVAEIGEVAADDTAAPTRYQALVTLWHSIECRHVAAGEIVDLQHFDDAGRAAFVAAGYVEPVV